MDVVLEKKEIITDFQELIYPYTVEDFSHQYWGKQPLLIQRENASYFTSLLAMADIDKVLDFHRPKGSSLRVVKNQEPLDPTTYENTDGSLNLNKLYTSYAEGYTLVINEIDRFWAPIQTLCHNLRAFLSHKTMVNMYLTPKNQAALLPHYDTHDVFVVQVAGKKHWKLYDTVYPTPQVGSPQPIFAREHLSNARDITLNAGDVLYIPRGIPHEAITTDESSLHLTIGVYPTQWIDVLTKSLDQIANTQEALRQSLPLGFLNPGNLKWSEEMLHTFSELLQNTLLPKQLGQAIQLINEEFKTTHKPMADGHFEHISQIENITLETKVIQRNHMNCRVLKIGPAARILFSGNVVKGPAAIASSLEFISDHKGAFFVNDIPNLSDANKLKLAGRLIRAGLLKINY
ncbi:cupin domain-containing protein [Aquimarina sp. 2201CG1-2-11]|uniref:cupin domain-containing protein n=1 Tax=Aquimarina discodermiae TaxID=3231043 RepID=UPI00346248B2